MVFIFALRFLPGGAGGRELGLGRLCWSHSTVCPYLLGQMETWQNRLGKIAEHPPCSLAHLMSEHETLPRRAPALDPELLQLLAERHLEAIV